MSYIRRFPVRVELLTQSVNSTSRRSSCQR